LIVGEIEVPEFVPRPAIDMRRDPTYPAIYLETEYDRGQ
jgi:hypothetical protein